MEPELVAPQGRRAEPGARHAQNAPAAEQTTDPELIEAEEQARLQATRFELGSMLDTQPVDRDFRDRAQAEIDTAMEKLGSTAVQLLSVDCRRTLCQLELSSSDAAAMADFLENFPAALGWSTDLRMDTRESPGNGVVTTLFMTRDGVAMPAIAAEQR